MLRAEQEAQRRRADPLSTPIYTVLAMAATFEPTLRGMLPLVGRESQRSCVLDAYRDAYNGARIVTLIVGDTGTGRSRLLDEVLHDSRLERSFVVRLRFHRGDEGRSDALLREAVIEALESRPFLRRSLESLIEQAGAASGGGVALGRALETIARRLHLVIAIDDIDGAGADALRSIEDSMSGIEGGFMVIATIAPGSVEGTESLIRHIGATERIVRLDRLPSEALRELIERIFNIDAGDDDVTWLASATLGLPILFREAISSLFRSGCVALHGGLWERVHPFSRSSFSAGDALPALRRRLEQLPDQERRWVAMTAMLGRRAPIEATYALGLPRDWYISFVDRELIEVSGKFIEFTHDLFFEAAIAEARRMNLYASLRSQLDYILTEGAIGRGLRLPSATIRAILEAASDDDRPRLLKTIADAVADISHRDERAIAATYFGEVRRRWNELAPCLTLSEELHFAQLHLNCLYQMGCAAEQVRLLHDVLPLLDRDISAPVDAVNAVHILCSLAETEYREKNVDAAGALLDRAEGYTSLIEPADRRNVLDRINYHRAWSLRSIDKNEEAAEILLRMIDPYDPDVFTVRSYDAVMLLANLTIYVTEPHARLIHDRLQRMLAACEAANERRAAMQIRLQFAFDLYIRDRYAEFEPIARQLLTQLHDILLPRAESNLWYALAAIEAERGEFESALATMDRCIELRLQTRSIQMWQLALISRVLILRGAQRNDEAMQTIEMIEEDARRHQRHYRRFLLDASRAILLARRGEWSAEAVDFQRLREIGNQEAYPVVEQRILEIRMEVLLHAQAIDADEAEAVAIQALDLDIEHGFHRELTALAAASVARALASTRNGRRRRLGALVDMLVERVVNVIDIWRSATPAMIGRYLPLFRQHVIPLLPEEVRRRLSGDVSGQVDSWTRNFDANILGFGRLRVLDRNGAEKGGRHFGTQKSDSKPRKLLAALIAGAVLERRRTREQLVDMVWGESTSDETAGNLFHVTLSGLRQVIGEAIDFDGATYALNSGRLRVDALDFLRLLSEAREADRDGLAYRAYDLLVEACSLYRGEFLEGIYDDWCDGPREDLRARARAARIRLVELALMRGEHDLSRRTIQGMMESDPADEEAMCLSLRLMEAEGERLRAIREYEEFSDRLQREYRVAPSRRLRELRKALEVGEE